MNLAEKIRRFAKSERIPESRLDMEELESFVKIHKGHGPYELRVVYDRGRVGKISLRCTGYNIVNLNECPHNSVSVPDEGSVLYEGRKNYY